MCKNKHAYEWGSWISPARPGWVSEISVWRGVRDWGGAVKVSVRLCSPVFHSTVSFMPLPALLLSLPALVPPTLCCGTGWDLSVSCHRAGTLGLSLRLCALVATGSPSVPWFLRFPKISINAVLGCDAESVFVKVAWESWLELHSACSCNA